MIHYFICFYSGFFFKYFGIVRIEWGICRVCPKTKCRYLRQVQSGLHQHLHHRCIHQPDVCFYHDGEDTNVWMMQTTSLIQLGLTQITFFKHIRSHLTGVQSCNSISCIEQENYNYFNITIFLQHWDTIYILINLSFRRK